MDDDRKEGSQSIDRAVGLLQLVGRAGPEGARLADLIAASGLQKPTARRLLLALMRGGLVEQDAASRRYFLGPETYVLGTLAGARFGIYALALDGLARLAQECGDCAFLSVPRDTFSVCLHREEGRFPIRTHVLQAGDRHPLGIGGGGLAILAALPDEEVERVLALNDPIIAERYPAYSTSLIRECVEVTRAMGYALNPGILMPGSWGLGLPVMGPDGRPVGALSIAAIESRLTEVRQQELVPLIAREVRLLEEALRRPGGQPARASAPAKSASPQPARALPRASLKVKP